MEVHTEAQTFFSPYETKTRPHASNTKAITHLPIYTSKGILMDAVKDKQFEILTKFIEVYCKHHHDPYRGTLCPECAELRDYARERLEKCPYDPKPECKDCTTHCYKPVYRKQIREVMKFSGMHYVKRGRLDWLLKYFIG